MIFFDGVLNGGLRPFRVDWVICDDLQSLMLSFFVILLSAEGLQVIIHAFADPGLRWIIWIVQISLIMNTQLYHLLCKMQSETKASFLLPLSMGNLIILSYYRVRKPNKVWVSDITYFIAAKCISIFVLRSIFFPEW